MSNKIILESFIKCHNCHKFKNINYTKKDKEVKAVCFCGTHLKKKIK